VLFLQIRQIGHQATPALQGKLLSPLLTVCEAVWNAPFSIGGPPLQEVGRRVGEGPLGGLAKWWGA